MIYTGLILSFLIILLTYFYQRKKFSYWINRGIPQMASPLPILGNVLDVLLCRKSMGQFYKDIYENNKELKYVGFYEMSEPALLIRDVGLIENILVKDFSSFVNRPIPRANPKSDVDYGLPQLTDNLWRGIRYKMTPAFSSGKLKFLFESMKPCSQNAKNYIASMSGKNIDFKEVTTRFTIDVIASCAFGLDVSKDSDSNSKFREMGHNIVGQTSILVYYFQLLVILLPRLAEKLGLMFTPGKVGDYFASIIKDTFKQRQESKVKRNDFVDFLLQVKEQKTVTVHSKDPEDKYLEIENVSASESFAITDAMLISQAFTFFSAGFDGLSTPAVAMLHMLAKHHEYQQKIRDELKQQIAKYGSLTYEALKQATFLDGCINEGLRMYPLASFLFREASKDYELESGVTIEAGTKIVISTLGLQMDPMYHPDPFVCNPERISGQLTATVTDFTNLPFGAGPRICIGMRMAHLIVKLFLATVILEYDVQLSAKCPQDIKFKASAIISSFKDTLYFDVNKIK